MSRGPVLLVPAIEAGRGGGHLTRCLALVRDMRVLGREALLFLPLAHSGAQTADLGAFFNAPNFDPSWLISETDLPGITWEWIILDRFQTPPEEFTRWASLAPIIGIDEGGPCRDRFDFLIDILPGLYGRSKPNVADVSLLPSLKEEITASSLRLKIFKVLVSFGQEDAVGLGLAAAAALAAKNKAGSMEITLLSGGLNRRSGQRGGSVPAGVLHLETIPQLGEHLAEYDLLITHYGITAFEALYAGVPVLLVSPGAYHEKLSKAAGFFSVGIGKNGATRLASLLSKKGEFNCVFLQNLKIRCVSLAARYRLDREPPQSLASQVNSFTPLVSRNCPVCGCLLQGAACSTPAALFRDSDRTYRRCPVCGIINMNRINQPPIEYEREYFFDFYKSQYGKTYIEDFPNLIAMGKRRLDVIGKLLPKADSGCRTLLDIGCAYGPFLVAAKEAGFSPAGIDPAEDAVRYVQQTMGLSAVQGFFPDCRLPEGNSPHKKNSPLFDAITLWYVIEHFRDCVPALAAIRRILKPGGILAFSTPSFSGVSGRFSSERFLAQSPADHWTIWSPGTCKKALALAGFEVKKIVVSGYHPERFPLLGKFAQSKKSPLYGLLLGVSKIFALGDTFEVYAAASRAQT
ncbi:hypothetical protein AGMMS50293_24350 [Spirochaetia bacterium]|nr:hypothetical protein AGMMS50293_24350 [Spirochaetia bacterium]